MSQWKGKITVIPTLGETEIFEDTGGPSLHDGVVTFRETRIDGSIIDHGYSLMNLIHYSVQWTNTGEEPLDLGHSVSMA